MIGMPVFNEERHISEALESLLAQTYENLSIMIFDNCSTDRTGEICVEYAKQHSKILYQKNSKNIGSALNFLQAVDTPATENFTYFAFARGNAVYSPNAIGAAITLLEENQDASLAYPRPVWIDGDSKELKFKPIAYYDSQGCDLITRSTLALWTKPFQFYGIVRFQDAKQFFRNYKPFIGDDNAFMFFLSLRGSFCFAKDEVWKRRYTYSKESYAARMKRYRSTFFGATKGPAYLFPMLILPIKLLAIAMGANIGFALKSKLILSVIANSFQRFLVSYGGKV